MLNAVDEQTQRELDEAWAAVEADPEVWVAVVTGAGDRAFSVGGDISSADDESWARTYPHGFGGLSLRPSLTVPVIARVNGYALGAGMEMALACDIIVAAEHAQFALPEPRLGRVPLNGGPVLLAQRVPRTAAMGLLLTGRRATAMEMHRIGLVNEVVPAPDLDAAVDRWVAQIMACAPTSAKAIKELVQQAHNVPAPQAAAMRLPQMATALKSANADEGIDAYRDKRSPQWTSS